jgi:hypothetical protein
VNRLEPCRLPALEGVTQAVPRSRCARCRRFARLLPGETRCARCAGMLALDFAFSLALRTDSTDYLHSCEQQTSGSV